VLSQGPSFNPERDVDLFLDALAGVRGNSPIEARLLVALARSVLESGWRIEIAQPDDCEMVVDDDGSMRGFRPPREERIAIAGHGGDVAVVGVFPQCRFGKYRVDFLASLILPSDGGIAFGVIECDGHNFHERTKEQAARDRGRDRWFTGIGMPFLRFTGSEIFASPGACARGVLDYLKGAVR